MGVSAKDPQKAWKIPAVLQMPDPKIEIDEVCRWFEDIIHPKVEDSANVLRSVHFREFGSDLNVSWIYSKNNCEVYLNEF